MMQDRIRMEVLEVMREAAEYGRFSRMGYQAKYRSGAFKPLRSGARSGRVKVYRLEDLEVTSRA